MIKAFWLYLLMYPVVLILQVGYTDYGTKFLICVDFSVENCSLFGSILILVKLLYTAFH